MICDANLHLVVNRGATCTFQVFIPTTWLGPTHHLTPWITAWNLPHSPNAGSARCPHNRVGIQQTRGQPPWLSRITIHPTLMLQSAICVNPMLFWTLSWWSLNCQPLLRISKIFKSNTQSSVLLLSATYSSFKESPDLPSLVGKMNGIAALVRKEVKLSEESRTFQTPNALQPFAAVLVSNSF